MPPPGLLDLTRQDLDRHLRSMGVKAVHTKAIWQRAHRDGRQDLEDLPGLPAGLAEAIGTTLPVRWPAVARDTRSEDGFTRKWLLRLSDGAQIETVLMRYDGRATVCVSTQAGCAMSCVFCATGQMGFRRHLDAGEIVAQVHLARSGVTQDGSPAGPTIRNVVFMGMGEPLHNYDAVMTATDILADGAGLGLSPRRLTVSTVGVVPGIRRLANERRPVSLAVSLHAATQDGRLALLAPAAKAWPLDELLEACHVYSAALDRHIFFEWTLIAGRNDREDDAHTVGRLLSTQRAHVNLIPLNTTSGFDGRPSTGPDARRFQQILAGYGIPSTVRQRRGIDIDSGCGQLASRESGTASLRAGSPKTV